MRRLRGGFTLIELLTVMAISAILLAIITIPMIQGFELTRGAQSFAAAQSRARLLMAQLDSDVGNAVAVRDPSGEAGRVVIVVPGQNGEPIEITLDGARLDLLMPARGVPAAGGGFVDPDTGKIDPTLVAPKGQVTLPVAAGTTIMRYWLGLRDPLFDADGDGVPDRVAYRNPYSDVLAARAQGQDNLFVLYRAEVPIDPAYFPDLDADGFPDVDDPGFFSLLDGDFEADGSLSARGQQKVPAIRNWLARAEALTDVSRDDAILPVRRAANEAVRYDGGVPVLAPLISFAPARVPGETLSPQRVHRQGEEARGFEKFGPSAFRGSRGAWSDALVRYWPSMLPGAYDFGTQAGDVRPAWSDGSSYLVLRSARDAGAGAIRPEVGERPRVFHVDPSSVGGDRSGGVEVFDAGVYVFDKERGAAFPFDAAIAASNARSNWLSFPVHRAGFVPLWIDAESGELRADFSIQDTGLDASLDPSVNVPTIAAGAAVAPSAVDTSAGAWNDPAYSSVNARFNKLWNEWADLPSGEGSVIPRELAVKRFVDLRFLSKPDGRVSPLNPVPGLGFPRATLTPGSLVVVGPDQRPGPNYGSPVRYTEVRERPVGPNQFLVNYVDLPEPDWASIGVNAPADAYDPASADPSDLFHAVLQAPYRKGYVEFNSSPNEPLPDGPILFDYRFQFTEPADAASAEYDTGETVEMAVTVLTYPQTRAPEPQAVTVRSAARVRNLIR